MPLPGRANSAGLRAVGMFFLYLLIYVGMFSFIGFTSEALPQSQCYPTQATAAASAVSHAHIAVP
jgi:hypothetical protein